MCPQDVRTVRSLAVREAVGGRRGSGGHHSEARTKKSADSPSKSHHGTPRFHAPLYLMLLCCVARTQSNAAGKQVGHRVPKDAAPCRAPPLLPSLCPFCLLTGRRGIFGRHRSAKAAPLAASASAGGGGGAPLPGMATSAVSPRHHWLRGATAATTVGSGAAAQDLRATRRRVGTTAVSVTALRHGAILVGAGVACAAASSACRRRRRVLGSAAGGVQMETRRLLGGGAGGKDGGVGWDEEDGGEGSRCCG